MLDPPSVLSPGPLSPTPPGGILPPGPPGPSRSRRVAPLQRSLTGALRSATLARRHSGRVSRHGARRAVSALASARARAERPCSRCSHAFCALTFQAGRASGPPKSDAQRRDRPGRARRASRAAGRAERSRPGQVPAPLAEPLKRLPPLPSDELRVNRRRSELLASPLTDCSEDARRRRAEIARGDSCGVP